MVCMEFLGFAVAVFLLVAWNKIFGHNRKIHRAREFSKESKEVSQFVVRCEESKITFHDS